MYVVRKPYIKTLWQVICLMTNCSKWCLIYKLNYYVINEFLFFFNAFIIFNLHYIKINLGIHVYLYINNYFVILMWCSFECAIFIGRSICTKIVMLLDVLAMRNRFCVRNLFIETTMTNNSYINYLNYLN